MIDTIHIQLDEAEGSLPRIVGLIERRGFHIERMVMENRGGGRSAAICVRPRDASRRVEVLGRQIDRLFGVRRCEPHEFVAVGRASWAP
jgi:acetolactate synthase-1/3 small subunit